MFSKKYLSRLLALVLVAAISLMGCTSNPSGLSGNYREDTIAVLDNLRTAIDLPDDASNKKEVVTLARRQISDYASRYRRNDKTAGFALLLLCKLRSMRSQVTIVLTAIVPYQKSSENDWIKSSDR